MKNRSLDHYRSSSILILTLLVFVGMIVTTLAQAEPEGERVVNPYLTLSVDSLRIGSVLMVEPEEETRIFSGRSAASASATPWLLADRVQGSYGEGVFHVHIYGLRSGNSSKAIGRSDGRMELILSAGSLDTEVDNYAGLDNGDEPDGMLTNVVGDYRLLRGDVFAISVGKRW